MELYILKCDHHEGQTIYGVFESKELALKNIGVLLEQYPKVNKNDYYIKKVRMNSLVEIEAHE